MSSESVAPLKPSLSHSGLQALLESARLLNASTTLEELLSHLMRTVMGRLLVTRGVIAIDDDGAMRVELARGVSGAVKGSVLTDEAMAAAKLDSALSHSHGRGPGGTSWRSASRPWERRPPSSWNCCRPCWNSPVPRSPRRAPTSTPCR